MIINLTPQLEAALNERARQRGVAPEALALDALRERFLFNSSPVVSNDERVRRLRQVATDCGVSLTDAAVSSEGIYV